MIHCADLSNPTKREDLAANWSRRIMEENFLQGDEEKSLGIPLNPLGDREQVSLCKCQVCESIETVRILFQLVHVRVVE